MSNKKRTRKKPVSKQSIENMKYEIASELGITMGPNTTSRANGTVGGEMTKRLVDMAEKQFKGSNK